MLALATAVWHRVAGLAVPAAASAEVGTSPRVLINEVYGGGGNSGAPFNRDFIELYNASDRPSTCPAGRCSTPRRRGRHGRSTPLTGTIDRGASTCSSASARRRPARPDRRRRRAAPSPMGGTAGKVALSGRDGRPDLQPPRAPRRHASSTSSDTVRPRTSTPAPAGRSGASNTTRCPAAPTHANTANNAADFTPQTPTAPGANPAGPTPDLGDVSIADDPGHRGRLPGRERPRDDPRRRDRGLPDRRIQRLRDPGAGHGRRRRPRHPHSVGRPLRLLTRRDGRGRDRRLRRGHRRVIEEFNGLTELNTSTLADAVTVLPDAVTAPLPVVLSTWPTSEAVRETLESMLVLPAGRLHRDQHVLDEPVRRGRARGRAPTPLRQPTDRRAPGSAEAAAVAADNIARRVSARRRGIPQLPRRPRTRRSRRRSSRSMSRSASAPR